MPVYHDGSMAASSERYSVQYPLIIKNATAEDEGHYTCVENAGSGDVSVTYYLTYEGTVLCHIM